MAEPVHRAIQVPACASRAASSGQLCWIARWKLPYNVQCSMFNSSREDEPTTKRQQIQCTFVAFTIYGSSSISIACAPATPFVPLTEVRALLSGQLVRQLE